jgi:adenylylsulfate kinase
MSNNITKHNFNVSRQKREKVSGHKGMVLWFTGLSGSGKSTIANTLDDKLNVLGKRTYILDGDNIRLGLNKDLGFSPEDRQENIRRISEVAKLFADSGAIVMTAFISPYKKDRDAARKLIGDDFNEIFVDTKLEECIKRDPKGLYKKAFSGEIKNFTGIDAPYEKPSDPELTVKNLSVVDSVNLLLKFMKL